MSYKAVQRISRVCHPLERYIYNSTAIRVNRSVLLSKPQLVATRDILIKRNICTSNSRSVEESKHDEKEPRRNEFTEGQDEFSKKAEEDKAKEAKQTMEDDEDEGIKESILSASLKFVPGYGWSKEAVEAGTESLGYPTVTAGVIADPSISLVHHHYQVSNDALVRLMRQEIEELKASGQELKVTPFIKRSIEKRLKMNLPYMSRWAEALANMTYPQNAMKSLNLGLELVDSMWHVAGDKDVDINWYTKRLTLLGIYKTTELAMMQDQSEGYSETWAFLDRRFDDSKNLKDLLGAPDDALKILGAVGSTVQAFLGVRR